MASKAVLLSYIWVCVCVCVLYISSYRTINWNFFISRSCPD